MTWPTRFFKLYKNCPSPRRGLRLRHRTVSARNARSFFAEPWLQSLFLRGFPRRAFRGAFAEPSPRFTRNLRRIGNPLVAVPPGGRRRTDRLCAFQEAESGIRRRVGRQVGGKYILRSYVGAFLDQSLHSYVVERYLRRQASGVFT